MATKPIERLLFAQGGNCFFCEKPLPREHASVEHLVAQTHGGKDNDENCVATCKTLNALFGRMSLKEKLKIVIHQKGAFKCPASQVKASPPAANEAQKPKPAAKKAIAASVTPRSRDERLDLVIKDLKRRGNSRPGKQETLENTIRAHLAQLGEPPGELPGILRELQTKAYVTIENKKVTYKLP
ncbi:HNH endonuclease [Aquabacterium sp.]|jgi:hypothetical protein|uniref:HNH endonuclease n=1 Tax=Aquabacterium sp. TaxID=1872578 RepID=UPI003BAF928E